MELFWVLMALILLACLIFWLGFILPTRRRHKREDKERAQKFDAWVTAEFGRIDWSKIQAGTITADKLEAGKLTVDKLEIRSDDDQA